MADQDEEAPDLSAGADSGIQEQAPSAGLDLLTLKQVFERMSRELGQRAPALISLKRWSASGALAAAQRFPSGRSRPLYEYASVKAICQSRLPSRFDDSSAAASSAQARVASVPGSADATAAAILPMLASIGDRLDTICQRQDQLQAALEGLSREVARASSAAENLDHTRRSLMARYDNELSAVRAQLEALQGAAKAHPSSGIDMAVARLMQAASRLEAASRGPEHQE